VGGLPCGEQADKNQNSCYKPANCAHLD
jgi:hypothetical protein